MNSRGLRKFKPEIILSLIFGFLSLVLTGCATYKFSHGKAPYDKGYLASRDGYTIPEYTIDKDNNAPELKVARERFEKRKRIVEDYYKRMGLIENRFKMSVWNPVIMFWKMVGGVFRLPFIAISDYRYNHNHKYRERIAALDAQEDAREEAKIKKLKDELWAYIQSSAEQSEVKITTAPSRQKKPKKEPQVIPEEPKIIQKEEPKTTQEELKTALEPQKLAAKEAPAQASQEPITAVITANPIKGYSPLKVNFSSRKSLSTQGKIISYSWDFGDDDTSNKPNPINTYLSVTYGSRYYTANLTVKDDKDNSATSSITIEVLTR